MNSEFFSKEINLQNTEILFQSVIKINMINSSISTK